MIVNLDFSNYERTIAKLRYDLFYIQKLKNAIEHIRDQNHEECVLQKLEDEINAFREMLPRLDKRRAELNAFGSVLKCFLVRLHY